MSFEIANLSNLLVQLRDLVQSARRQALRAVDTLQVRTCWEIGRHIVEFEQQGTDRAAYGARLIPTLAESFTVEFGRGFDERNLLTCARSFKAPWHGTQCVTNKAYPLLYHVELPPIFGAQKQSGNAATDIIPAIKESHYVKCNRNRLPTGNPARSAS